MSSFIETFFFFVFGAGFLARAAALALGTALAFGAAFFCFSGYFWCRLFFLFSGRFKQTVFSHKKNPFEIVYDLYIIVL